MKILQWNLLLLLTAVLGFVSCRSEENPDLTGQVDRNFAIKAAEANLMGIRLGQLVQTNAGSQDVKEFGKNLADYYSLSSSDLLSIARRKGISLPTALGTINQKEYERLSEMKGSDFDSAYIDWVIKSRQQTIDLLQEHSTTTADADLKSWASTRISTLEQQLSRAKTLQTTI